MAAKCARGCGVYAFLRTCQSTLIWATSFPLVGQVDVDRELDLAVGVQPLESAALCSASVAVAVIGPRASFR